MAKQVWVGAKCFLDGHDVSGDVNAVAFEATADVVDVTTISDTARTKLPGLKAVMASLAGYWEAGVGEIDPVLFERIGASNTVLSICPEGGDAGDRAFFAPIVAGEYAPSGSIGEALAFTVTAEGTGALARGVVLHHAVDVSASGTGAAQELIAGSTSQTIRAALHVYAVTGTPTLTVKVQSDDTSGFASATDRLTFAAKTAVGAELVSAVAVGGGDVHWRASYTISGTGSVRFVVLLSIQ